MQNKNILYPIIGLLVGIVGTLLVSGCLRPSLKNDMAMPHGSMEQVHNMMNMESSMNGMMAGLQGKTGDEFDKEFLAEMIVHHQGAVDMAKAVLATSKRPELMKLANDIISAQTKEISMMKEWQKAWFK